MKWFLYITLIFMSIGVYAQTNTQLALLKYKGGGDWYANLETSLPNLIAFGNEELKLNLNPEQAIVEAGSQEMFQYPFIHMTGHGNVVFTADEVQNLRQYLLAGGFLHIDDNYGMDKFIRPQMKQVFPELEFVEIPSTHPIFQKPYKFSSGLPKVHEHDNKRPQALGLFYKGRLICLYTFESDLGDGWEDTSVHGDSEENHRKALQMGANILYYVFVETDA